MQLSINSIEKPFSEMQIRETSKPQADWILHATSDTTKIKMALSLASQLQELHKKGFVHRDISIETCFIDENGMPKLHDSEEQAQDSIEKHTPGIIGRVESIPPERFSYYLGSWYPDDIYALGCIFFELSFLERLPWHSDANVSKLSTVTELQQSMKPESELSRTLLTSPSMLKNIEVLQSLACWMIHPNPKERPEISTVCKLLQDTLPKELPVLTPFATDKLTHTQPSVVLKIKEALKTIPDITDHDITNWAIQATHLLEHSPTGTYHYTSRKASGLAVKIIASPQKNWLLFLPKKHPDPNQQESGTFKIGRRATVLRNEDNQWKKTTVYTLVSKKTVLSGGFKGNYRKEMSIQEKFSEDSLFPKHILSFTVHQKPHKRLSLYESFPYSLYDWLKKNQSESLTIELIKQLAFKVWILYMEGYAHRDIKIENILVSEDGQIRLCDPDTVVQSYMWRDISEVVGTLENLPPERLRDYAGDWHADDVYALGCVFHNIVFKTPLPWHKAAEEQNYDELYEQKLELLERANEGRSFCESAKTADFISCMENLICWMLHPEPTKRPTIDKVHQIVAKYK